MALAPVLFADTAPVPDRAVRALTAPHGGRERRTRSGGTAAGRQTQAARALAASSGTMAADSEVSAALDSTGPETLRAPEGRGRSVG